MEPCLIMKYRKVYSWFPDKSKKVDNQHKKLSLAERGLAIYTNIQGCDFMDDSYKTVMNDLELLAARLAHMNRLERLFRGEKLEKP